MEKINEKLNLGPRTIEYLSLNNLPRTTELEDYSIEQLSNYKLPPKCIKEIQDQLKEHGLNFKG